MRFFKYQTQLGSGTRITFMDRQLYILKVMGQYKNRWKTGWHSQHPCSPCSTTTEVCCRSSSVTGIRDTFYHHSFLRLHNHWTNKQNPHCMRAAQPQDTVCRHFFLQHALSQAALGVSRVNHRRHHPGLITPPIRQKINKIQVS